MQFLKGRYRKSVTTMRFHDHGRVGALLLPEGTYRVERTPGKWGDVVHVEDGSVQHALVQQKSLHAEIRMKPSDIRTHLMDIFHEIRKVAQR
jgi:hypothetical protein